MIEVPVIVIAITIASLVCALVAMAIFWCVSEINERRADLLEKKVTDTVLAQQRTRRAFASKCEEVQWWKDEWLRLDKEFAAIGGESIPIPFPVRGVSRMKDQGASTDNCLMVTFDRPLTDDEMRIVHDRVRGL